MRGNQTDPKPKVEIQPPAEPGALREAAESESAPARGFVGTAPAQGSENAAPPETFAGPDPRDVAAVEQLVALAIEGAAFALAPLGKFLRGAGKMMFDEAGDAATDIAPHLTLALVAQGFPTKLLRYSKWLALPIRFGLSKAAPERFANPPPGPPPRQPMQPGGQEPPKAPEMPPSGAPAAPPGLEIQSG
jgi:hypothetical protein